MTKQEAYLKIRAYLTRPGARRAFNKSNGPFGACAYEVEIEGETHRCAVGCLLERADLDRSMAAYVGDVYDLFEQLGFPPYLAEIGGDVDDEEEKGRDAANFLFRMQQTHDHSGNWDDDGFNVAELDAVARSYGLTVPS